MHRLQGLRRAGEAALSTMRLPTSKQEEFRFTDVSRITGAQLAAPPGGDAAAALRAAADLTLTRPAAVTAVVLDGALLRLVPGPEALPPGVFVGASHDAPADVLAFSLGMQSGQRGGAFAALNAASAAGVLVVHVPAGVTLAAPVHVVHLSSPGGGVGDRDPGAVPMSSPRTLVVLEEGAAAGLVEEFVPLASPSGGAAGTASPAGAAAPYYVNAVLEVELDDRAALSHAYVATDVAGASHTKATFVHQVFGGWLRGWGDRYREGMGREAPRCSGAGDRGLPTPRPFAPMAWSMPRCIVDPPPPPRGLCAIDP